jgi:predicted pyridoxine 5'-phosphate oxidase superfamily flavin-nucleotide-binding protein
MAKLTEQMKALVSGQLSYVATSMPDGKPSIAVKGLKVIDDEHVAFFEIMGGRTWQNIQKNPWVAIAVADRSKVTGFRFVGKVVENITSGPLYEEAKKISEMMKMPKPPKAAVKVKIEEIYDLGKGGFKVD